MYRSKKRNGVYENSGNGLSDLWLYHWAPRSRRASIKRLGLVPGSISIDKAWRPPYVCFSDDPLLAWSLSGHFHPEVEEWDLWAVWHADVKGWEAIPENYRHREGSYIKEFRVYHRVFKRHVHYVASRSQ